LFQRIKKVFKNNELQDLINHTFANVSPYFIPNVATLTSWIFEYEPDVDPFISYDEEFRNQIIRKLTEEVVDDVQPVEIINTEDDTGEFPREERVESKIESIPQITEEVEYYENSGPTEEEIVESEMMIREDRMNELRKLQGLQQQIYYLINKQLEKELTLYPPKDQKFL
jgi:hypothetical protein